MGAHARPARRRLPALGPGDILFIDSSHQLKPGSDVDFILNAVLPLPAAGVRVHFHDIFLPDDYPEHWNWRSYSRRPSPPSSTEICSMDFASHATVTREPEKLRGVLERLPLMPGAIESSLWLTKL